MRSKMLPIGSKQSSSESIVVSVQLGFTLVELLVVIAIMVMIALAAPTLYSRTHQAMALKATTAAVVQSLRTLHLQAQSELQIYTWTITSDSRGYRINDQSTIPLSSDKVHLRFDPLFTSGLDLANRAANEEPAAIRFFPDGSASGGRLFVENDQRTRVIVIDWLTGRVRIDD